MPKPKGSTKSLPSPTGECLCGCGGTTKPGRHFLQGHDRRAESEVIKAEYGGSVQFLVAHGYGPGVKKVLSPSRRKVLGMLAIGVGGNLVYDALRGAGGYIRTAIRPRRRTFTIGESRIDGPDTLG